MEPELHTTEFISTDRVIQQHKLSTDELKDRVAALWTEHKEMLREDAMMAYLKVAKDLHMYGVNYFDIKDLEGKDLCLGKHHKHIAEAEGFKYF